MHSSISDEHFYLHALNEAKSAEKSEALWAKALTLSKGNDEEALYTYVSLRVSQLTAAVADLEKSQDDPDNHTDKKEVANEYQIAVLNSPVNESQTTADSLPEHPQSNSAEAHLSKKALDNAQAGSPNALSEKQNTTDTDNLENQYLFDINKPQQPSNDLKNSVDTALLTNATTAPTVETVENVTSQANEADPYTYTFKSSFLRKLCAAICLLVGIASVGLSVASPFVIQGEELGLVIAVAVIFILLAWPLIRDGYNELTERDMAGWGTLAIGLLIVGSQVWYLHHWLAKMGFGYSQLHKLPVYPDLFILGVIAGFIGLLLIFLGWSGLYHRKLATARLAEYDVQKSSFSPGMT